MRKKIVTKLISLVLLVVIATGSLLYYAYFDLSELVIFTQARTAIHHKSDQQLDHIRIPAGSFNAHEREIWYQSRLYDVAHYSIARDTAIIAVLEDKKEAALRSAVQEYFNSANSCQVHNGNGGNSFEKHKQVSGDAKCLFDTRITFPRHSFSATRYGAHCTVLLRSRLFIVISPPPDCYSRQLPVA